VFGTRLADRKVGIFPRNVPPNLRKEVVFRMMKFFNQILFMALLVVSFSMTAMAQRDDNQNRPDKDPPKIEPKDKDRPKDRPKDNDNNNNNRPKKPRDGYLESESQTETSSF
jgi:Ni/Co efflux regulator RcnB